MNDETRGAIDYASEHAMNDETRGAIDYAKLKADAQALTLTRRQRRAMRRTEIRTGKKNTAYATSQCRCGQAFGARTSRLAIAGRRDHERQTGHGQ